MRVILPSAIQNPKWAFTLVELLTVITILGILISLLLPAVQAAREGARKLQCQTNMKQLGLAILNYESQWTLFPPSGCWTGAVGAWRSTATGQQENWCILILPFLEQQPLYDKFDRTQAITASINKPPRSTPVAVMLCPSDPYNQQPFMGEQGADTAGFGNDWARGNYGANASLGFPTLHYGGIGAGGPTSEAWGVLWLRGIMGGNCSIGLDQITDGASNTVLLGELRAGVTAYDPRGVWALSGACSSALWGHGGGVGDDGGPNAAATNADDTMNCTQVQDAFGGADSLAAVGMPCYHFPYANNQQTARSMHVGGVNTCFADGSIHWISDYIQAYPSSSTALSVWDKLMCSADGQSIGASQF